MKIIIIISLVLLISHSAYSQTSIKINTNAGVGNVYLIDNNNIIDDFYNFEKGVRYSLGLLIEKPFNNSKFIETGFLVDMQKNDYFFTDFQPNGDELKKFIYNRQIIQLKIPFTLKKEIYQNFGLNIGINGIFTLSETNFYRYKNKLFCLDIKTGIFYNILNKIEIGINYTNSMFSIFKKHFSIADKFYYLNYTFTFSLSYKLFNFK